MRHLIRQSLKPAILRIIDACIIPTVLYLVGLRLGSIWWGLLASTAWTCARLIMRHVRHQGTSTHILTASSCLLRLGVAFLLASPSLWAIQGVAQTFIAGSVLFGSSLLGRFTLLEGALRDVLPALQQLLGAAHAPFTRSIGVLFGAQQILLAFVNVALMNVLPLATYLAVRPLLGYALGTPTILLAFLLLRRRMNSSTGGHNPLYGTTPVAA